jgi:hypothetical protein
MQKRHNLLQANATASGTAKNRCLPKFQEHSKKTKTCIAIVIVLKYILRSNEKEFSLQINKIVVHYFKFE